MRDINAFHADVPFLYPLKTFKFPGGIKTKRKMRKMV